MSRPMISYRGPEARALIRRIADGFSDYLGTRRPPVLLTASANRSDGGDRRQPVVAGRSGARHRGGQFAERFLGVAEAFGLAVRSLETPWGEPAAPERLRVALRARPEIRAVLLTHSETSTVCASAPGVDPYRPRGRGGPGAGGCGVQLGRHAARGGFL